MIFRLNNRNRMVIRKKWIEKGSWVDFRGLNLYLYGDSFFGFGFI